MTFLLFSGRRLLLLLILVQSVSLYKIYAVDDDGLDSLSPSLEEQSGDRVSNKNNPYDDDMAVDTGDSDDDDDDDGSKDNAAQRFFSSSQMRQGSQPFLKRSSSSLFGHRSSPFAIQRRNNRPHWNPLVAAYKRCGDLSSHVERDSCFKNAIQLLFVHQLRKK